MIHQVEFYRHGAVRARLLEYAGSEDGRPESMTAEYLVGFGEALLREGGTPFRSVEPDKFDWLLAKGLDVFRSNWDKVSTLGVLDFEYFNPDYPGEAYLRPDRVFALLEPVRVAAEEVFARYGIPTLTILTGQGYHFAFRVARETEADAGLVEIGRVDAPAAGKYRHPRPPRKRPVSLLHARAFDGMGRLMEFLTHEVLRQARPRTALPVVTTDVRVGPGEVGREAASVDLSMYGDPLYMRDVRMPFSTHQKHKVARDKVGAHVAETIPVQVALPIRPSARGEVLPLAERLRLRRHFRHAAEWAEAVGDCGIPEAGEGVLRALAAYRTSALAAFHRRFDEARHDPHQEWPRTYDRLDLTRLPPCIAAVLERPNPRLLQPTHIQAVTRTLLAEGWHPRHIAGLLRSKYERNHGWSEDWSKYDAAMRADFYVRLFAGQIAVGLDRGLDHNCVSHAEKGCCVKPFCGFDLSKHFPSP